MYNMLEDGDTFPSKVLLLIKNTMYTSLLHGALGKEGATLLEIF